MKVVCCEPAFAPATVSVTGTPSVPVAPATLAVNCAPPPVRRCPLPLRASESVAVEPQVTVKTDGVSPSMSYGPWPEHTSIP